MHTLQRACTQMCTLMSQHLFNVHIYTCMALKAPVWMHATLPAKNAHIPRHVRLCNDAEASLPWKLLRTYLESCASIVQAVVWHPSYRCLDEIGRLTLVARETVQIHASSWRSRRCGVAQASFDHSCWCRPHPVCPWVALMLGRGVHFIKSSIFAIFWREFSGSLYHDPSIIGFEFLVLIYSHTASNPITSGARISGAR